MNTLRQTEDNPTAERSKTYRPVTIGACYVTERYGQRSTVWVVAVKRKDVVLKRSLEAVDSFTENRSRFDKFYQLLD